MNMNNFTLGNIYHFILLLPGKLSSSISMKAVYKQGRCCPTWICKLIINNHHLQYMTSSLKCGQEVSLKQYIKYKLKTSKRYNIAKHTKKKRLKVN